MSSGNPAEDCYLIIRNEPSHNVSEATRQSFIDRHIFYDGRYLGVELKPMIFVDYARPRPMAGNEKDDLLKLIFHASGWDNE